MSDDIIRDFPNLNDAKEAIERIKEKGFPNYDNFKNHNEYIKVVSDLITEEFGNLPNLLSILPRKNFAMDIFRVRPLDDIQNINLFSQHSYPPINVVGFGRCNFPNYPVFYGSNNPLTALLEVARENGGTSKKYCISKWNIESENDIIFQSFIQAKLIENSDYDGLRESQRKRINEPFKGKLTQGQCDGIILLLEFLDTCFITDKKYAVSSCLAHRAIYSEHNLKTDILMYPSIQTQYTGINFAINPNYVDNYMQLNRLYIMELVKYNPETREMKFSLSQYGEIKGNGITWKNINPNDQNYLNIVKDDFNDLLGPDSESSFEEI
ncbi:hypothetical protein [Winogradskyella helgolandensis]|uniref:hypothetical protein n=1 Tax=Winogradskyella helgolandensis TaxID=2697010 RepID=UPI0015C9117A|nr:hypothetical protein [Winogradskyella helgolandensis]